MPIPIPCTCGVCIECDLRRDARREYHRLYARRRRAEGAYLKDRREIYGDGTDGTMTTVSEDCKKLEQQFPWLRFTWREIECTRTREGE